MLEPLPYQQQLVEFLKTEEAELWAWFRDNGRTSQAVETARLDLLKATYRLDQIEYEPLYLVAQQVAESLEIDTPITLYRAAHSEGLNAALAPLPDEAHIVLMGPVLESLDEQGMKALVGHELGHYLLDQHGNGDYAIARQLLDSLTWDSNAHGAHFATARLYDLYTQVFCDRAALRAVGQLDDVITMLARVETGSAPTSAAQYLREAEQALASHDQSMASETAASLSGFVRARALQAWNRNEGSTAAIAAIVEGKRELEHLDLLGQRDIELQTRSLLTALLSPPWFQTDAVINHAKLFFADFAVDKSIAVDQLANHLSIESESLRDYFCFLLLDFCTVDRRLEDGPLSQAIHIARSVGLGEAFATVAQRELRVRKTQYEKVEQDVDAVLAAALGAANHTEDPPTES
ncbi:MAG: M48 family metalloprotease [Pirellulaceae bacterium]|jgi:hypothetical protein|nr:M48 family metalloprotease [Pirellulaceae bacterium]MDP7014884.1 M48 family metalloprotease [Pirellulaceae bacterium]